MRIVEAAWIVCMGSHLRRPRCITGPREKQMPRSSAKCRVRGLSATRMRPCYRSGARCRGIVMPRVSCWALMTRRRCERCTARVIRLLFSVWSAHPEALLLRPRLPV